MNESAWRDLRQQVLATHRHLCWYCKGRAHQIRQRDDQSWVPVCRHCQHILYTHHFPNETAQHHFISKYPPRPERPTLPITVPDIPTKPGKQPSRLIQKLKQRRSLQ